MYTVKEQASVHRKKCDLVCYHLDNYERGHQKQAEIYVNFTIFIIYEVRCACLSVQGLVLIKIFMPFCTGDLRNAQREWRELYRP